MGKPFHMNYNQYDTSTGYGNRKQWQAAFEQRMNLHQVTDSEQETYQDVLDPLRVCRNASDLKKAYHKLMMQYHPDKSGDTLENKIRAQMINDLYFKLKERYA